MKKTEKILIGAILLFFVGVLIYGNLLIVPLFIFTFTLSICYVIGGFYFLNNKEGIKWRSIAGGLILGSSLSVLLFTQAIPVSNFRKIIVLINIVFSVVLIGLWIYKKNKFNNTFKNLLYRSIVLCVITSFFTFSHVKFKPYRKVLLKMVCPDSNKYHNLMMFDKINEYKELMTLKKYDIAIIKAKEAIIHGKEWVNYDTLYYQNFSGVYESLANAYRSNGNYFYHKNNFSNAYYNYIKADSILTHNEHKPKYIESTESDIYWNKYNLLLTYDKLLDDDNYDSEFEYLIDNYSKVKDSIDNDYYYIIKSVAENCYRRSFYDDAISINKTSLEILNKDSINNLDLFKNTYIRLIKNYLVTDSIQNAKKYLNEYGKIVSNNNCKYLLYKTSVYLKENITKALELAKKTCDCYEEVNELESLFVSKVLLLQLELKNSNFKNFNEQLLITQDLVLKTNNKTSNQVYIDELLGQYNFIKGNYITSKKHYQKAFRQYKNGEDLKKTTAELKIAQINEELDISYDKSKVNLNVLELLSQYETITPSSTVLYNDLGNINTVFNSKLSDSLFNLTIESHKNFKITKSAKLGIAYNGLATNELFNEKYKKSDSVYMIAIKKLDEYYGKQQNINQLICYLNITELKLNQKRYIESSDALKKANETKTNCFNKDTTVYDAYILNLEGDLIRQSKKNNSLSSEKYSQALVIAQNYFNNNHSFIKSLRNKIE